MRVKSAIFMIVSLLLAGCASRGGGDSATVPQPLWVGSKVNDLKKSPCNCGGIISKEELKAQEKAQRKAPKAEEK